MQGHSVSQLGREAVTASMRDGKESCSAASFARSPLLIFLRTAQLPSLTPFKPKGGGSNTSGETLFIMTDLLWDLGKGFLRSTWGFGGKCGCWKTIEEDNRSTLSKPGAPEGLDWGEKFGRAKHEPKYLCISRSSLFKFSGQIMVRNSFFEFWHTHPQNYIKRNATSTQPQKNAEWKSSCMASKKRAPLILLGKMWEITVNFRK